MTKIHDKIFNPDPDSFDSTIFSKCIKLSWTEPKKFHKR